MSPGLESGVPRNGQDLPLSISVIIPVYNDSSNLIASIEAIFRSSYRNFEVIVVDDGSTDDSAEVARSLGARVHQVRTRGGPAAARNLGARLAEHPYLLFVDADVCVANETLRQVAETFRQDPTIDAVFGSYDRSPGARNLVSQYRNLLHHHVHQRSNREAFTFWSGCGAVKRSVLLELGGFDTGIVNASIEDIELGSRLRGAGYRVVLAKEIQVQHLKRWTFWSMIRCDVFHRGIPWTRLLLREGSLPRDLNLQSRDRWSTLLALALALWLLAGSWYFRSLLLVPMVIGLTLLLADRWTGLRSPHALQEAGLIAGFWVSLVAMLVTTVRGHNLLELWLFLASVLIAGIVMLNLSFYWLFVEIGKLHWLPLVIPLHILFYLYSGLAFTIGLVLHLGSYVGTSVIRTGVGGG